MSKLATAAVVIGSIAVAGSMGDATADGSGTEIQDRLKTHTIKATDDVTDIFANGIANAAGLLAVLKDAWASLGVSVNGVTGPAAPPVATTQPPSALAPKTDQLMGAR